MKITVIYIFHTDEITLCHQTLLPIVEHFYLNFLDTSSVYTEALMWVKIYLTCDASYSLHQEPIHEQILQQYRHAMLKRSTKVTWLLLTNHNALCQHINANFLMTSAPVPQQVGMGNETVDNQLKITCEKKRRKMRTIDSSNS